MSQAPWRPQRCLRISRASRISFSGHGWERQMSYCDGQLLLAVRWSGVGTAVGRGTYVAHGKGSVEILDPLDAEAGNFVVHAPVDHALGDYDVHAKWWTPLATITRITTTPEPRGATEALHSGRLTLDCHVHEAWLSMTGWDTGEPEEWGPLNQYSLLFSRWDAASHLHALDFSRSDAGRRLNSVELGSLHGDKHMNSLEFDADCDLRRQPLESMDNPETTTSVATTGTSGKTPVSRDDENKDGRFWCAKILRNQRGNDLGACIFELTPCCPVDPAWQCKVAQEINKILWSR